jgi:hypothetical protein
MVSFLQVLQPEFFLRGWFRCFRFIWRGNIRNRSDPLCWRSGGTDSVHFPSPLKFSNYATAVTVMYLCGSPAPSVHASRITAASAYRLRVPEHSSWYASISGSSLCCGSSSYCGQWEVYVPPTLTLRYVTWHFAIFLFSVRHVRRNVRREKQIRGGKRKVQGRGRIINW